jgi:hypothetical protein
MNSKRRSKRSMVSVTAWWLTQMTTMVEKLIA